MAIGSEILSYGGNAAAGGGYSDISKLGADAFSDFERTLTTIAQDSTNRQIKQYDQAIKDRDTLAQMIAKNQIDFEVDEAYRPALEGMVEEIKNLRTATPNIMKDPKKFAELQAKIGEFQSAATAAKANTVQLKKMQQMYADNPDEEDRKNIASFMETQRAKGVKGMVTPYQKLQSWGPELFGFKTLPDKKTTMTDKDGNITTSVTEVEAGEPGAVTAGTATKTAGSKFAFTPDKVLAEKTVEKDGVVYKEKVVGTDIKDIKDFYRSNADFVEGPGKNLINQAKSFYKYFTEDPGMMSPETLRNLNAKINAINSENGLQKGDRYYTEPIGTENADGTVTLTADPIALSEAFAMASQYQPRKTSLEVDEKVMEARLKKGQTAHQYASAEQARANAAQSHWQIRRGKALLPHEIAKMKADAAKAEREGNKDLLNAYGATEKVVGLVDLALKSKEQPLPKQAASYLGVSDKATMRLVPRTSQVGQDIFATPVLDREGKVRSYDYPGNVWMVTDGDVTKFVGMLPGGNFASAKVLDVRDAPSKIIQKQNNYNLSDNDNKAIGATYQVWDEYYGTGDTGAEATQTTVTTPAATVQQTQATTQFTVGERRTLSDGRVAEWDGQGWKFVPKEKQ